MMTTIHTMSLYGIDAIPVSVEVQVSRGLHRQLTGLPDQSIRETMDRMPELLSNLGFKMPRTRLTIHLAPGSIAKKGNGFDLPILLGILLASEQISDAGKLSQFVVAGEVTLEGKIKSVRRALCMAQKAQERGYRGMVLPQQNADDAALIDGLDVYAFTHVREVVEWIKADYTARPHIRRSLFTNTHIQPLVDFKDVIGQPNLKRAMEIAAAGGHHAIMVGPPGVGKSLVAKGLHGILPPMSREQILETSRIYSVSQQTNATSLVTRRPFRSVHHTITEAALVGGGFDAMPGEVTLAHNGVLFMDEFSEFRPSTLEALRQPLEDRMITVARNKNIMRYAASFTLIAAMNPCLCGYLGHPERKCKCSKQSLYWYRRKISGPLLDRFDLQVVADPIVDLEIDSSPPVESSLEIKNRVSAAHLLQRERFKNHEKIYNNSQLPDGLLSAYCPLDGHSRRFLLDRLQKLQLSTRAYAKILKVARTIADLHGKNEIELSHIAEAIHFRALDVLPIGDANFQHTYHGLSTAYR
jgi:magnesium chelatase family protein